MKLLDADDKLRQLHESIRFGNKEISEVMRRANEFAVGIEYEFRYNDDMRNDFSLGDISDEEESEYIHDYLQEQYDEYMRNERAEFIPDYASDMMTEANDIDDVIDECKNMASNFQLSDGQESGDVLNLWSQRTDDFENEFDLLNKWSSEPTDIDLSKGKANEQLNTAIALMESLEYIDNYPNQILPDMDYDLPVIDQFLHHLGLGRYADGSLSDVKDSYDSILREIRNNAHTFSKAMDEIRNFQPDQVDAFENHGDFLLNFTTFFFEEAESLVTYMYDFTDFLSDVDVEVSSSMNTLSILEEITDEMAEEAWDEFGQDNLEYPDYASYSEAHIDEAVDYVHNTHGAPNGDVSGDTIIEHIVENTPSISDSEISFHEEPNHNIDAEIVTDHSQHNLNDALKTMEEMFGYIEEFGETNQNTGMHVNMSVRGADMSKINKTKLLVLLDNKFMLRNFGVREYVSDLQQEMKDILKIREAAYQSRNPVDFIETFVNNTINFNQKYQGINFGNVFPDVIEHNRRVEFRYLGDVDYHRKYDEMEWNIQRYAYMMLAALDEDFEREAYLRSLWRMVNNAFEETYHKYERDKLVRLFNNFDLPVLAKKAQDMSLTGYLTFIHALRDYGLREQEINGFIGTFQSPKHAPDPEEYKEYRNMFLNSGLKGKL